MEVAPSRRVISRLFFSEQSTSFDPPSSSSHPCRESISWLSSSSRLVNIASPRLKPTTFPSPGRALSSKPSVSMEQVPHRLQAQIPEMRRIDQQQWLVS
ncbi:hypothetical protein Bca4012_058879 [Brassica carinata]|uniref:Uncharacterized protein n=1 Tax=Brassica carinata TaxID=52824 RepID=A0A8X8B6K1_BRACI|nr:hypothetical protein Bca52824_016606 [Brassica carinata]